MNSETVIATAATVIAVCALWVGHRQARDGRRHNRQSVRPLLHLRRVKHFEGTEAGLGVTNAGLGPAIVTRSVVRWDGEDVGSWDYHTQDRLLSGLPDRPKAHSLRPGAVLLAGQSTFLLVLDEYVDGEHDWFWELLTRRLVIEIHYESLYGGEDFRASPPAF